MVVRLRLENLGSHVLVGPAEGRADDLLAGARAPAEIAELGVQIPVQKDVLGIQVAVDDPVVVDVLDGGGDLQEEVDQLVLGDRLVVPFQKGEEVPVRGVLQNQIDLVLLEEEVEQLDDVRVVQSLVELDFLFDVVEVLFVVPVGLDFDLVSLTIFIANFFLVFLQVTRWTVAKEPLPRGLSRPGSSTNSN